MSFCLGVQPTGIGLEGFIDKPDMVLRDPAPEGWQRFAAMAAIFSW
jgi:hypothetical protein